MNALPWYAALAPRRPAVLQDDAFDDSYAWVGYESAQPLTDTPPDAIASAAEAEADL